MICTVRYAHVLLLVLCTLLGSILAATPAQAHQTAISTLNVEVRPDAREVDMLLAISPEDVGEFLKLDPNGDGFLEQAELPEVKPQIAAYLEPRLKVTNNGEECEPSEADFVETRRRMAALLFRETARCDQPLGEVTITNRVLLQDRGGYTHYGQIQLGEDIHTTVFNRDTPDYTVEVAEGGEGFAEQSFWEVFATYIWQGVLHIVLGLDHVLFVLCLLLAAREFRRLVAVVTSFTIAHSITLALSALEVFTIAPGIVEPLIALSIAWVAVELLLEREPGKHLYALTFGFGLLHGFGFSYVLRDEVGLPTDALVPALLSFNVGVELGQLAIVAAAFPLVVWARKKEWGRKAIMVVAGAVLLLALYWLVTRIIGV